MCPGCDPRGQYWKVPSPTSLRVDRRRRERIGSTRKNFDSYFLRLDLRINLCEQTEGAAVADTLEELGQGFVVLLDLGSLLCDQLVEIILSRVDQDLAPNVYSPQASLLSVWDNLKC